MPGKHYKLRYILSLQHGVSNGAQQREMLIPKDHLVFSVLGHMSCLRVILIFNYFSY